MRIHPVRWFFSLAAVGLLAGCYNLTLAPYTGGSGGQDAGASSGHAGSGGTVGGGMTSTGGISGAGGTSGVLGGGDAGVRDAPGAQPDVPTGGTGAGGMAGTSGLAGTTATGGTTGSGGTTNTGGTTTVGGTATVGGMTAVGGMTSTGGVSTGGAGGTGGTPAVCVGSRTQCSGNSVQTCTNGQWGAAIACGPRQTCAGPVGAGKCTCNVDPVCSSVGGTCASATTLATCAQDAQGCFYESSAMSCARGACSGAAGSASCCTNACTTGTAACFSSTSLGTCALGANGCTAVANPAACSAGLVCERYDNACLDPSWDEWPIPNSQADVTAGAPNGESYTDNGDGTVTDNVTGLMWQQAVPSTNYTWANAAAYCPTLTLAGHSDWRLPSVIELVSIVDLGQSSPSINGTYFPNTPAYWFWSSSPVAGSPSLAWDVNFSFGNTDYGDVSVTDVVRCVR